MRNVPVPGTIYQGNHITGSPPSKDSLRILTWNIHRGFHLDSILSYLQSVDADILLLQEVDWGNERTGYKNIAEEIAQHLSMEYIFVPEFEEIPRWTRKIINNTGGGIIGNAILSKLPLMNPYTLSLRLKHTSPRYIPSRTMTRRLLSPIKGGSYALSATISIHNMNIQLYTAHLEISRAGLRTRAEQFMHIHEDTKKYDKIILGGDFNTAAHGLFGIYNAIENSDAFTLKNIFEPEAEYFQREIVSKTEFKDPFNKRKDWTLQVTPFYRAKLDWLLTKNLPITNHIIGDVSYSDHKPLIINISLT